MHGVWVAKRTSLVSFWPFHGIQLGQAYVVKQKQGFLNWELMGINTQKFKKIPKIIPNALVISSKSSVWMPFANLKPFLVDYSRSWPMCVIVFCLKDSTRSAALATYTRKWLDSPSLIIISTLNTSSIRLLSNRNNSIFTQSQI